MKTLNQRVDMLYDIFQMLEMTSSRLAKEDIISVCVSDDLKEDFEFCLEVLANKHPLGYKLIPDYEGSMLSIDIFKGIKDFYEKVLKERDASYKSIDDVCRYIRGLCKNDIISNLSLDDRYEFWCKLVNREFRLGIGKSLLEPSVYAPMLAHRYEKKERKGFYYVTEKLDGVRCICYYDGGDWNFVARSGKSLNISFDMSYFDEDMIYDGELIIKGKGFNYVNGVVNSDNHPDKDKVTYNLFDCYKVDDNEPYLIRRERLNSYKDINTYINIVPVIEILRLPDDEEKLTEIFSSCVNQGKEGVMLNLDSAPYAHTRCDNILKMKDTWTLDMRVVGLKEGKGKYEGMIGSLECEAISDGITYRTFAGGLSDEERHMTDWIGQLVEVMCNGTSQNARTKGTNVCSIRHARFIRRRDDKTETSVD